MLITLFFWPQILTLIARERQKLKLFGVQVLQMRVHNLWRNQKCLIEYTPLKLHGRRFCIHLEQHSLVLQKNQSYFKFMKFSNIIKQLLVFKTSSGCVNVVATTPANVLAVKWVNKLSWNRLGMLCNNRYLNWSYIES